MFPQEIIRLTEGLPYTLEGIGCSGAEIRLYDSMVLKVEPESPTARREREMLSWLSDKLPVPKLLCGAVSEGKSFILMSRLPGMMTCDEPMLKHPDRLASILAEALKRLWQVDIHDCPVQDSLIDKLILAEYNVQNGLIDLDRVDPSTFGPGGFASPEHLLAWLKENRPPIQPVFSHGDFCLPNIFTDGRTICGYLDLGQSGVSSPYQDIALCYRSLQYNLRDIDYPAGRLFDMLGITPDWDLMRYFLLLDELL